ncbi:MAG: hypothetical protein IKM77_07550 [Prevotella sp.]|nr:hypothetical protein [Prevotella sp.]
MTQERFETIKADFVNQYRPLLCEESMTDIEAAHDFHAFADVLRKYMAYNTYRPFPDVEWVRKWFAKDKETLHEEHIYLDEMVVICEDINQDKSPIDCLCVMLYGSCSGTAIFNRLCRHYLMLQDTSKLDIIASGRAIIRVKLKGDADIFVLYRDKTSIIKKRRYETANETKWV